MSVLYLTPEGKWLFSVRMWVVLKRTSLWLLAVWTNCLTAEAVQSASLTLESVDDVHGRHRLALGVLSVRDSVRDLAAVSARTR